MLNEKSLLEAAMNGEITPAKQEAVENAVVSSEEMFDISSNSTTINNFSKFDTSIVQQPGHISPKILSLAEQMAKDNEAIQLEMEKNEALNEAISSVIERNPVPLTLIGYTNLGSSKKTKF